MTGKLQLLRSNQNEKDILHKAESITRLQRPYIKKILVNLAVTNPYNADLLCEYIIDEQTQFNIKESTKEGKIKTLVWLSAYFNHEKSFKEITKQHILSYLNSLRRPLSDDASQRWVFIQSTNDLLILQHIGRLTIVEINTLFLIIF